eukprot:COSAG01_NODE_21603_length_894_cov_0.927044_1_plen_199_part_10
MDRPARSAKARDEGHRLSPSHNSCCHQRRRRSRPAVVLNQRRPVRDPRGAAVAVDRARVQTRPRSCRQDLEAATEAADAVRRAVIGAGAQSTRPNVRAKMLWQQEITLHCNIYLFIQLDQYVVYPLEPVGSAIARSPRPVRGHTRSIFCWRAAIRSHSSCGCVPCRPCLCTPCGRRSIPITSIGLGVSVTLGEARCTTR